MWESILKLINKTQITPNNKHVIVREMMAYKNKIKSKGNDVCTTKNCCQIVVRCNLCVFLKYFIV
jgi:hypothetical protein